MKATMNTNEKEGTVAHVELTPNDDFPLPSTFGQLATNKLELKKLKYKIIGSIILGLGCIAGAIVLTYIGLYYWKPTPNSIQMFHVVLHDKTQPDSIRLDVTVDPTKGVEYVRSPLEGQGMKSKEMLGLKDFNKGIVAYKEEKGDRCYITKIFHLAALKTFANGSVQEADVNRNETFMLLNQTIHPFVLQLAAGDKIVAFCGTLPATWMIPEDEDQGEEQQQETHTRTKRWGCWNCGRRSNYRYCWWNCSWWGWRKYCTRRCSW